MELSNRASKQLMMAEKVIDVANLVAVGLVVPQAFSESYNWGLAIIGFLTIFSIYLLIYLLKIE